MLNIDDLWFTILVTLWSIPWKGVAMWRAAGRGDKVWFIVFLVVNLLAIPEIFYIFFVSNKSKENKN